MQIAKIVNSQSHYIYLARVLDNLEVATPPSPTDFALARFVMMECEGEKVVGVIADSQLINPAYGNYGPRLTANPTANQLFSPDYLHDQGVLLTIILLGSLEQQQDRWFGQHQLPTLVLPIYAAVKLLNEAETLSFHRNRAGQLRLGYYAHLLKSAPHSSTMLLMTIINWLETRVTPGEQARLILLRQNLEWQQTMIKR